MNLEPKHMKSTQKSTIHFLNLQFQYDIGMHFFHEKSTQKSKIIF